MKNVNTRKLNTRMKKFILTGGLLSTILFLSGCVRFDLDTGEPQGFLSELIYNFLVVPLSDFLDILANFLGSYGVAIIIFTILFRLLLIPLTLKQQRSMAESQIKMQAIQPITQEIQAEIQDTDDPTEKQALNLELMEIYRENNINLGAQLSGCFPLLLQMPIFIAMLQVLRGSEAIANSTFLGMSLGENSALLAVLTGIIYFIQSRMMIQGMPEESQKTAGASMYITPIMMLFIGFSSPAGISLYWMISGIFSLVQQAYNQFYFKPKLEAETKEQMGEFEIARKRTPKPKMTKKVDTPNTATNINKNRNRNRDRNAGKQNRNN